MIFNIELPHVGESVTEAVIAKWLKSPGDFIEKYDPIVEVVTDKVNMDVPSPTKGTLTKILVNEGDTVPMGAIIAEMECEDPVEELKDSKLSGQSTNPTANRIGTLIQGANVGPTGGEFLDTSLSPSESTEPSSSGTELSSGPSGMTREKGFSPIVARLASQHGIDLSTVEGTGLGGRVTKKDILEIIDERSSQSDLPTSDVPSPKSGDRTIELSPTRKIIAEHMVKSMSEIPHAWSAIEVDVTGMVECRALHLSRFHSEYGVKLTYLPITLSVVANALLAHPLINSTWHDGNIVLKGNVNIGVAVGAEDGLVVPVLHKATGDSIVDIAQKLDGIVTRARTGSMSINDVQGGTFTLNNTGALGSVWGGAIINYPQAAILTTESIVKRPKVVMVDDVESVSIRSMMNICLSFDHRIIDGLEASRFLQSVKSGLEAIDVETELK